MEKEENAQKKVGENTNGQQKVEPSSAVYELPGEPAIVIDGMPKIIPIDDTAALPNTVTYAASVGNTRFGEWLVGREVRKLFGDQYYFGKVTEFDDESGWYRVVYEDGDLEDLEWNELEQVLQPLDIMIPLKSLALKTLKKRNKPVQKSKSGVAGPQKQTTRRSQRMKMFQ